jgi:hypothetical protein
MLFSRGSIAQSFFGKEIQRKRLVFWYLGFTYVRDTPIHRGTGPLGGERLEKGISKTLENVVC